MFLFMSDDENILNILEKRNLIVSKYSGEMDFKSFIYDKKNLDHYSHVIVDLESLNNTEEEMLEAIKAFLIIYKSKLILFSREIDDDFLSRIIELDFFDIVIPLECEQVTQSIEESLTMCIFENKSYRNKIKEFIRTFQNKYNFSKDIKILVSGLNSILYTTKTALNIAMYLNKLGAKVSYTEVSSIGYLKKILNSYKFKDSMCEDISYFYNGNIPLAQGYNFNIIDMGILDEKGLRLFGEFGDVKITAISSMETELEKLVSMSMTLGNQTNIIFDKSLDRNTIVNTFKDLKIYFNTRENKLFSIDNTHIYREILKDYIIENIN